MMEFVCEAKQLQNEHRRAFETLDTLLTQKSKKKSGRVGIWFPPIGVYET